MKYIFFDLDITLIDVKKAQYAAIEDLYHIYKFDNVVDVDNFTTHIDKDKEIIDRKLLYVGMTRASERLVIHANNFNVDTFAKKIRDLYYGYKSFA